MGPKELNGLGLSRVEKVEEYEEVAAGKSWIFNPKKPG